jgi:hypothetical protein
MKCTFIGFFLHQIKGNTGENPQIAERISQNRNLTRLSEQSNVFIEESSNFIFIFLFIKAA